MIVLYEGTGAQPNQLSFLETIFVVVHRIIFDSQYFESSTTKDGVHGKKGIEDEGRAISCEYLGEFQAIHLINVLPTVIACI